ncbi:MAG: RDD family protein, partial [Micrococcaceae bacterium]|nr:RDD family protein [Micrococcaceae bacterium]
MDSNTSTTDNTPSPRPVDRATTPWRFPTGEWAFLASDWRAFIAAAIDATLVLGAGLVQYLTVMASPYGTQPQAFAGAALVIVLTAWVYGFICFSGHTLGTLLCGTRIMKVRDGSAPGMLRAGWVMFVRTVIWVVCPIAPPLAAPNTNGKNIPQCRRFHISIRKDADVSGLPRDPAALEASHGRTNEAHKYVDPMPVAPEKSMDSYHPMVPSQFKDGSWGIQARLWKIILAWAIDLAIALGVVFALSAALLGETPRHSWE